MIHLYRERGDRVKTETLLLKNVPANTPSQTFLYQDTILLTHQGDSVYRYNIKKGHCRTFAGYFSPYTYISHVHGILFNNYYVVLTAPDSAWAMNVDNGKYFYFTNQVRDESIYNLYPSQGKIHLVTNKKLHSINKDLQETRQHSIQQLLPPEELGVNTIVSFLDDDFWGLCYATSKNGWYINYNSDGIVKKDLEALTGYEYITSSKERNYWWSDKERTIALVEEGGYISKIRCPEMKHINKIIPYDSLHDLILETNLPYLINNHTGTIKQLYIPIVLTRSNGIQQYRADFMASMTRMARDASAYPGGMFISHTGTVYNIRIAKDTHYVKETDWKDVPYYTYDAKRNMIWTYDRQLVKYAHVTEQKTATVDAAQLQANGIYHIEKIITDQRYGNILVKDKERLFIAYPERPGIKELFTGFNLKNSIVKLHGNKIMPIAYHNNKQILYTKVIDLQTGDSLVLLNTDKGFFEVNISKYSSRNLQSPGYKFLITNADSSYILSKKDTIPVDQNSYGLQFDIINPNGAGELVFKYKIGNVITEWQNVYDNQISLQALTPGQYYSISVMASDNIWCSDKKTFIVYITPY